MLYDIIYGMKANEVMKLLQISRSTLLRWRKDGILNATKLPSGQYDWDANSVFKILNKGVGTGLFPGAMYLGAGTGASLIGDLL